MELQASVFITQYIVHFARLEQALLQVRSELLLVNVSADENDGARSRLVILPMCLTRLKITKTVNSLKYVLCSVVTNSADTLRPIQVLFVCCQELSHVRAKPADM